ncbi:MAG TPA: DUF3417 domain-containing protein, partial [Nitrospirales bacterium]|nr:DUF3417 domain-containing protein [Nitrospirales bacterium]
MKHALPSEFTNLSELAHNLWWSWSPQGREVFSYFDPTLWRLTHHNPIKQMQEIDLNRLEVLRQDVVFIRKYTAAMKAFHEYLDAK